VPEITSRQHPIVKAFKAAARGDHPHALIDGWHLLHEAVASRLAVDVVAFTEAGTDADAKLIDELRHNRVTKVVTVSRPVMDALSPVRSPAGAVALVEPRHARLAALLSPEPPLVVVVVDVQDPGNAGAVVRSAEAGGATGVVFAGAAADPWGWKALRASMGSTFRLPVVQQRDAIAACDELRSAGLTISAAVRDGGVPMYDADLRGPTAFLLGSEGRGLPDEAVADAGVTLTIPMCSPVESLNVAVAAGILVYEARRQRALPGAR
jgi:RNA methyltransferase, TrmH family